MEIANYIDYQRPMLPSIDLNIAQNAMSTIQQGSEKALEYESELKNAVAQLDLNEAEDGFRQGLVNEIETATEDGNEIPYYAMPNLIKAKGNIFSSPALMGRLKAQQAYKQYQAQIDARNDLNEDTKEWAKELNPYHYADKVDNKGNVIGGSAWTPNFTPVESMDINDMLRIAAQYATPDSGGGTTTTFLDANGNPTSQPTGSIGVLNTTTGSWERLTSDKLRAAVDAAMRANPKYAASIKQDYDVLKWKWDKGETDTILKNEDTGAPKTFEQYLDDIIDPFIRARRYNNYISKQQYYDSALALQSKIKQYGSGYGTEELVDLDNKELPSAPTHPYTIQDEYNAETLATVDNVNAKIRNIINNVAERLDTKNLDIFNDDNIVKALADYGVNSKDINNTITQIKLLRNQNKDYYDNYNELLNRPTKEAAGYIMKESIINGRKISSDDANRNPYLKKYNDNYNEQISNVFGNSKNIGYITSNQREFNNLIHSLGDDEQSVKELGFNITKDNGKYVVSINRDNGHLLYALQNAGKNALNKMGSLYQFEAFAQKMLTTKDDYSTYGLCSYNDNISEAHPVRTKIRTFNKKAEKFIDEANSYEITGTEFYGATPDQLYYKTKILNPNIESSERTQAKDADGAITDLMNTIVKSLGTNTSAIKIIQDGEYVKLEESQRNVLTDLLNSADSKNLSYTMVHDPWNGIIIPQVSMQFKGKGNDKNPFAKQTGSPEVLVFTADNLINDTQIKKYNGSAEYAAGAQLYRNKQRNKNTNIGVFYDENGVQNDINIVQNLDGTIDIADGLGTILKRNINETNAKYILSRYNILKNDSIKLSDPNITAEEINEIGEEIGQISSDLKMIDAYGSKNLYNIINSLFPSYE